MYVYVSRVTHFFAVFAVVMLLGSATALAQSDQGLTARQFGLGQPSSINDLPPGQLRQRLESLPPQASAKALKWLQDFEFTGGDLESLYIDDEGGVLFIDSLLPDPADGGDAGPTVEEATPTSTLDSVFRLHSKPGAATRVFIDFDGHVITNTAWNSGAAATYYAQPYDLDGDPTTFNDTERGRMVDIWHRVSEDLAPFDIDVTTEEPATFDRYTGRILVTNSKDATGVNMPYSNAGGVAYVNVFGRSDYGYYSPALVYFNNVGAGGASYVAEVSSHEFGHNAGLSHDGTTTGTTYYAGHGSGLVSWAPIMGNSYNRNVTQWSKGEYANANQLQDDVAILGNKLGYAADDHGDTIAAGTPLMIDATGNVISSNPEHDPDNLLPQNKGIIHSAADVDVFTFTAGAGSLSLTVTPAWDAFYRATDRRGANLDIKIELRDNGDRLIAADDNTSDTKASVSATVTDGTYHLLVSGVGNTTVPYSDYASQGMYFINGTVPISATADTTPPLPNPMSWASAPAADSESAISMVATTAVDETSAVQYRFNCVSGGTGCVTSNWQSSQSWTATGLAANTQYTFTVAARDASGNQTAASAPASATTAAPPPFTNFVATGDTAVAGTVSGTFSATHADDGTAQAISEIVSGGKPSSRYSYLEHRWSFTIGSGETATVFANAWSSGSSDGDVFRFQYSVNGGSSWSQLFDVSATNASNMESFQLPAGTSGGVLIRVIDTNRSAGAQQIDTVRVDHLFIQVANASSEPPDGGPSNLAATAVSASRIDLAWQDNATNESSYLVERSADGSNGWTLIAELPANSQSHADTGLQAATTYYYRVSAFNLSGQSLYATANATTTAAPPPPALSLNATGYKVKGVAAIDLSWSGANSVDIYRNGSIIAPAVGGSAYTDNTGSKGGGTYEHRVCVAGGTTDCSNVTVTTF